MRQWGWRPVMRLTRKRSKGGLRMKLIKTGIMILAIALRCNAELPPETKTLHSGMYTIQFTLAPVNESFSNETNWTIYGAGDIDLDSILKKDLTLVKLDKSGASYLDFATAHIKPEIEFSAGNELVSGTVHLIDSRNAQLSCIIHYEGTKIQLDGFALVVDEWACLRIGKEGSPTHFMLIKLYEPTN
jgi:hypothetical protein